MPKLPCSGVLLALTIALTVIPPAAAERRATAAETLPTDIVLLLDNSSSMKVNDPHSLAKTVAGQFVRDASADTRLAILVFDEEARFVVSLAPAPGQTRDAVVARLDQVNYEGLATNIPGAVSQAIHELKLNSRAEATKSMILLTDGVVDTGDKNRDLDDTEWLREILTADAAHNDINIFSVALTNKSDTRLLHALAKRTGGEYFWVARPEELPPIFERIRQRMIMRATPLGHGRSQPSTQGEEPAPRRDPRSRELLTKTASTLPFEVAQINSALTTPWLQPPDIVSSPIEGLTNDRGRLWLIGISLVLVTLIVLVLRNSARSQRVRLRSRERSRAPGDIPFPEAVLYDLMGITGRQRYELNSPITTIGRFPSPVEKQSNQIVIAQPTIGRIHAAIERKHSGFWLVDRNSKNGTFVNDYRVVGPISLTHGDRVRVHNIEFEFALTGFSLADKTIVVGRFNYAG